MCVIQHKLFALQCWSAYCSHSVLIKARKCPIICPIYYIYHYLFTAYNYVENMNVCTVENIWSCAYKDKILIATKIILFSVLIMNQG